MSRTRSFSTVVIVAALLTLLFSLMRGLTALRDRNAQEFIDSLMGLTVALTLLADHVPPLRRFRAPTRRDS